MLGGKARGLEQVNEAGQLPKRHGLGLGEAVLDLARRQRRRQIHPLERRLLAILLPARAVDHFPMAVLKPRLLGVDAEAELVDLRAGLLDIAEEEDGDVLERDVAGAGAFGMQHALIALLVA